jgi:cellulose synthase operon protein C
MDRLRWILVRQGKHEQGLSLLRHAHNKYPDSLNVRYHISYALAAGSEKDRAITELDAILGMDTDCFERDEAEELLTSLRR